MRASVVVVLKNGQPQAAGAGLAPARPVGRFSRILKEHDAAILPGATTAAGMVIDVPDMDRANRLAEALRALNDVDTAYAKPGEELP
jgi:hypothetical protein